MTRATILSLLAVTAAAACGDDDNPTTPDSSLPAVTPDAAPEAAVITVPEEITTDTTWTAAKPYLLPRNAHVFVKNNATLTIEPGTEIRGERASVLTISRGSKIMAVGTAEKPIVFTSAQMSGSKTAGYWGGLLILGKAPVNVGANLTPPVTDALFEAFSNGDGDAGRFGGGDPADNSGVIKYVRIEFGGYNFTGDREFNNLTLCGVGAGTAIDFVQVHGGSDDGIEFFGGTVNVKHIVSSQNQDDGFDTDNGWSGKAQFVIVQDITHPAGLAEASNGYESDNHADLASYTAIPRTLPTVANVTLIGDHEYTPNRNFAAVFRRGTGGHYTNHVWFGFARGPELRDDATKAQAEAGNLTVQYSIFFNNDSSATQMPPAQPPVTPVGGTPQAVDIDESVYLISDAAIVAGKPDPHNLFVTANPGLPAGATSKDAPDFKPAAGSVMLDATKAGPTPNDPFFEPAPFFGAIGTVDWTAGWTKYPLN